MTFNVKHLHQEGFLKTNDIKDIYRMITCDLHFEGEKNYRECNLCFGREVETSEFEDGKQV